MEGRKNFSASIVLPHSVKQILCAKKLWKWLRPCHSHSAHGCCWHLSSRQRESQRTTPKRRRNMGLPAKTCNSLPLHLSQSPFSSSLISRSWLRSSLLSPDLLAQTCHKTFAHPPAEPGFQSILRQTATAVAVCASSFWLKAELAGRHLPMENRLKKKSLLCLLQHRFGSTTVHPFWSILFPVIYSVDLWVQPDTRPQRICL